VGADFAYRLDRDADNLKAYSWMTAGGVRSAEARELENEVLRRLYGSPVTVDFRVRVRPGHKDLVWQVRTVGAGAVLLPCGRERLQGEIRCSLVDEIPNPVLLVR
jgi:hypothetical protein